MDESERIQRYKRDYDPHERNDEDDKFADRIAMLLNDPRIDMYCMVDAYYYDFSGIPKKIQEDHKLWRDVYLIFGITTEGEIVSKWVDRWDLDSSEPIVDGKVIHKPYDPTNVNIPEIKQNFNAALLSTPIKAIFKIFE